MFEEKISISVPINMNENTLSLYNSLNEYGHDLFDVKDSFYHDICVTYI